MSLIRTAELRTNDGAYFEIRLGVNKILSRILAIILMVKLAKTLDTPGQTQ